MVKTRTRHRMEKKASQNGIPNSAKPVRGVRKSESLGDVRKKIVEIVEIAGILEGFAGAANGASDCIADLQQLRDQVDSLLQSRSLHVDENRAGGLTMDQIKGQTVGRVYALVARAEIDSAGRLGFVPEPAIGFQSIQSLTRRIAEDVNGKQPLPGYESLHQISGDAIDAETIHAVEEALTIDSGGALVFVEDAAYAAGQVK